MTIGVWTPFRAAGPLGEPADLPLGRAALALGERGVVVVIGSPSAPAAFDGVVVEKGRWQPVSGVEVHAVYDRFPSGSQAAAFDHGRRLLGGVPIANPPWFTELCRDKLQTQRQLERGGVEMPDVTADVGDFAPALETWGSAFLKPRFGSFGQGVRLVTLADPLPGSGSWVLQRAIAPSPGFAGVSVRVLVQRIGPNEFVARTPVVRRSADDPVVNAARGAELVASTDPAAVQSLALRAMAILAADDELVLEAGVDAVLDPQGKAHLIEVNSRPRGRLRALARLEPDRFADEHVQACMAPLQYLAR